MIPYPKFDFLIKSPNPYESLPSTDTLSEKVEFAAQHIFFKSRAESIYIVNPNTIFNVNLALHNASQNEKGLFLCRLARLHILQRAPQSALRDLQESHPLSHANRIKSYIVKAEALEMLDNIYAAIVWYRRALKGLSGNKELAQMLTDKCKQLIDRLKIKENLTLEEVTLLSKFYSPLDLFQDRVDLRDAHAMVCLGYCFAKGAGVQKNLHRAVDLYVQALAYKSALACLQMGVLEDEHSHSVEWYKKGEKRGSIECMIALGSCYLNGHGVEVDVEKAVERFNKGAEMGNTLAKYLLGTCYLEGKGVAKDPSRAIMLFQEAADAGNIKALDMLASCYIRGVGVVKDEKHGLELWEFIASLGYSITLYRLGCYYSEVDKVKAFKYFKRASNSHTPSKTELGICLLRGIGTACDVRKGLSLLEEAAEDGHQKALEALVVAYDGKDAARKAFWSDQLEKLKEISKTHQRPHQLAKIENYINPWNFYISSLHLSVSASLRLCVVF
jgi:TPR repeat protein